ncbi:MAG TPA: PAS domain S-box protein [Planctomycetota bacterium]|nr:PAS domain S-box protein [Planctomycetota bacterium]
MPKTVRDEESADRPRPAAERPAAPAPAPAGTDPERRPGVPLGLPGDAHALLAAIVQSSDDAIVSKTLDGIITSWNDGAERLFGYTADEILGRSITTLIPPELLDEETTILSRLRAGERIDHYETIRLTKHGERREVSITVSPVHDAEGHVIGASKVARDITDRRAAERGLAEADRRKDEFLAMLGHELRNPLAPIRNVAEILRRRAVGDPDQEHLCQVLDRQVQQMTRLLDDLLDMSRIRQGKLHLKKEAVDVLTVVARAVETSRPLIDARRHALDVTLPKESVRVQGDVARLVQMLGNLINNAAKYTPEGGRISITARASEDEAEIAVKDTGVGIAPAMQPRVFDMFVQGDQSQSYGGLGLGLPLVRTIAELHSGTVSVLSDGVGRGSEFVIRLPRLRVSAAQRDAADERLAARTAVRGAKRVLIVDDNCDAADSLAMLLRLGRHEVLAVSSGREALEAVRGFRPDLVLLDIGLPDLDGYEVARRLRAAGYQATLAAVTGFGQVEDRDRARLAGFDHHLVKPVDPKALQSLLA